MKIQFKQIEPFVKSPDKTARVILIYGPDAGLASERAAIIGKSIVDDLQDPFNVVVLDSSQLAEDPARLNDEANAISMMGGDRLIRIPDGGDKLTILMKRYLTDPSISTLVIIQAKDLGPRSSLRKLCESAKNAAALPCYVEDTRDLLRFIGETLKADNFTIERDALSFLASSISGDRRKVRSEVEKLMLYKGKEKTSITMDDVCAACGVAGAQSFDDLVYNVGGKNTGPALKAYNTLIEEGTAFIAIIRTLQNHFRRLHLAKSHIQGGMDMDSAMKKLSPPIFFKQAPMFKSQMNSWSLPMLDQILGRLSELEAQCKQTGMPVETLCSQAILAISKSRTS